MTLYGEQFAVSNEHSPLGGMRVCISIPPRGSSRWCHEGQRDLRVLIVDDEQLSTSLLSSIVDETNGFVVEGVCKNGREAIEVLQERPSMSCSWTFRCPV
ncbi:MAG: hypothetical protein CM15mP74_08270 [Halieaceae bacterium]|nr:MAG: hypothetical protein CM15mP74_08270 [Halieaceae bacterium]